MFIDSPRTLAAFVRFLPPYWNNSQGFISFYPFISESFRFFLFVALLITSPMPQWRRSWLGSLWNTLSRMARKWISWEETQRLAKSVAPFSTGCMRRPMGTCLSLICKVSCLSRGNFYLAYVLVRGQFGKENPILHSQLEELFFHMYLSESGHPIWAKSGFLSHHPEVNEMAAAWKTSGVNDTLVLPFFLYLYTQQSLSSGMFHIWILVSFEKIYSFKKNSSEKTPLCLLNATSVSMGVTPLQFCNVFGTGEDRLFLEKNRKSWNLRQHPIFFYKWRQEK